jgi:hypothetical protein
MLFVEALWVVVNVLFIVLLLPSRWMTAPRVRRWRVEARLVGLAGADGLGEGVVDFEDDALGAVVAVELLLVLAADEPVNTFASRDASSPRG